MAEPRLAFEGLLACDLTLAERACTEAGALGGVPPARAGQGKTPEDGFVFIEQNDLAPAGLVCEGCECDRGIGEGRGVGIKSPGGAVIA